MRLYSPVIGEIFALNGAGAPAGAAALLGFDQTRSHLDRSILAHMMQTPWDSEFHQAEPVLLAGNAASQRVTAFTTPVASCGLVRGVAMGVSLLSDFDNIRWAIRVDGTPLPGFDNIRGPFGVFVYPKPVLIPLYPDQTVEIVASNLTALPIADVTGYLMGTFFPSDVAQAGRANGG